MSDAGQDGEPSLEHHGLMILTDLGLGVDIIGTRWMCQSSEVYLEQDRP